MIFDIEMVRPRRFDRALLVKRSRATVSGCSEKLVGFTELLNFGVAATFVVLMVLPRFG